jgi:very-short-patch-repair endonuclease
MTMRIRKFKPIVTRYEMQVRRRLEKKGVPFTPQKKIYTKSGRNYLVDIFIPSKIVVEVGYIGNADVQEDEDLKASGYIVLRFRNKEVRRNVAAVVEQIEKTRASEK